MERYVAFLRGINVGKNTKVSMDSLRKLFSGLGFKNARTYINSGNVLFESDEAISSMEQKVSSAISGSIGNFKTMLRPISSLKKIPGLFHPNAEAAFATFFEGVPKANKKSLENAKGIKIVRIMGKDVLWLRHKDAKGYADIEKLFGQSGTTRGLNTIKKILEIK